MQAQSISPYRTLQRWARLALTGVAAATTVAVVGLPGCTEASTLSVQSSLYATSMDVGGESFSDPLASSPLPPPANPTPVPEPASLLLFGSGLAGLAVVARRLHRKAR